jgi:hypothetical protein
LQEEREDWNKRLDRANRRKYDKEGLTGKREDANVTYESGQEGVEREVSDQDHVYEL